MQVDLRLGEYIAPGAAGSIKIGRIDPLHLRAEFDQIDAQRISPQSHAVARVRGGIGEAVPLRFMRFEPLMVAKSNLTNSRIEIVDTRVLQVLYAFDADAMPAFVGQMVDVSVEGASGNALTLLQQSSRR